MAQYRLPRLVPALAALLLASSAVAAEPVVIGPSMIAAERVALAYPSKAYSEGVSGQVMLYCLVTAEGRATDCRVLSETPPGYGFAAAAIAAVEASPFRPLSVDGVAQEARVRVPISFSMP